MLIRNIFTVQNQEKMSKIVVIIKPRTYAKVGISGDGHSLATKIYRQQKFVALDIKPKPYVE